MIKHFDMPLTLQSASTIYTIYSIQTEADYILRQKRRKKIEYYCSLSPARAAKEILGTDLTFFQKLKFNIKYGKNKSKWKKGWLKWLALFFI